MIYNVQYSNKFKKDVKLAKKRHLNTDLLHEVIELLRLDKNYQKSIMITSYLEIMPTTESVI